MNPGRVSQLEMENGRTEGPTSDGATAGAIKGRLSCGVCSGSRTGPAIRIDGLADRNTLNRRSLTSLDPHQKS